MAWFAVMGAESVAYHEATVLGRDDDHPGRALDYYGSRGETPLRWGGAGAARLGLHGEVTPDAYRLAFGPGGFRDPLTGERLVSTRRPGVELVVSAHKSLSLLGLVGRADHMHAILDAETAATMEFLDTWMQARGGRRGRATRAAPTGGLVYAATRHATSRLGDPALHDHVLVANVCEMLDTAGGHKALYSALVRDLAEAAAMTGRLCSAAKAIELGYAIEPDDGRSGRARDWRIAGIPAEVCEIFSKRSDEIVEYLAEQGYEGHRARNVAARKTRAPKRATGVDELMPRWIAELEANGWTVERLAASLDAARAQSTGLAAALTDREVDELIGELVDPEGEFLRRGKVFGRSRLVAEIAPHLYGHDPAELDEVVDRVLASEQVVPLIGIAGAREQPYTATAVLATEQTIADTVERLAAKRGPEVDAEIVRRATAAKQAELGRPLSAGQRRAVKRVCGSGRPVDVVVGVAGSGKTTALDAASRALEAAGYRVFGTATSGQAARTLGREAAVPAATIRSLLWRLDHGQVTLDPQTVVVLDEAAMTADVDLARLLLCAERACSKVVLVGDPRQLTPVGPGGALQAVLERHPDIVTVLDQNLRQRDPAERQALDRLRAGGVDAAVGFYAASGRIRIAATRTETLAAMIDAWVADTAAGHDTLMLAWRRASVADLNRLARARADERGWLAGDDLVTLAAASTQWAIRSSPSALTATASWSRANAAASSPSTTGPGRSRCTPTTAGGSPSPARRSTPSTWTTATPSPSTASRAPRRAGRTTWPRAVAASSPTSPCPAPVAPAPCTRWQTTSTRPSRTSRTTGRVTATNTGSPAPVGQASTPPPARAPTTRRLASSPSSSASNASPHPTSPPGSPPPAPTSPASAKIARIWPVAPAAGSTTPPAELPTSSTTLAASDNMPNDGWAYRPLAAENATAGAASPSQPLVPRRSRSGTGPTTRSRPSSSSIAASPQPDIASRNSRPMPGSVSDGSPSTLSSPDASSTSNGSFDCSTTR